MSKFRALTPITGIQHFDQTFTFDATQRGVMGAIVPAVDPYWGGAEFIYVYFSGIVREKGVCLIQPVFDAILNRYRYEAAEVANTANLAQFVGVALLPAVAGQYGWLQISGITPVNSNAAVAVAASVGIAAVGQAGANTAGKQLVGARVVAASTTTAVKAVQSGPLGVGVAGSTNFMVNNTDGWFVGGYVSGTGIAAGAKVTAIDTQEQIVTVSAANTAVVSGNVTFTYNNATVFYNVVLLGRPFAQGAIT